MLNYRQANVSYTYSSSLETKEIVLNYSVSVIIGIIQQ